MESYKFDFSRTDADQGNVYVASHEIFNVIEVKFPQDYFGPDDTRKPPAVWIGIELEEPRIFADIVAPDQCRGCGSLFRVSDQMIETARKDFPEAENDREAIDLYRPNICLECLDGIHREREHIDIHQDCIFCGQRLLHSGECRNPECIDSQQRIIEK